MPPIQTVLTWGLLDARAWRIVCTPEVPMMDFEFSLLAFCQFVWAGGVAWNNAHVGVAKTVPIPR